MKIALVQDELVRKGGAEQVALSFLAAFPDAPIYTLSYNKDQTYPEFRKFRVIPSWFGKIIKDDINLKRFFYPFAIWAMESLDLSEYDVILQSTTHCSKYIKVRKDALVITYCHTPFRLVWRPNSYEEFQNAKGLKSYLFKILISKLKEIDYKSAQRTDFFITNSKEVVPRIVDAYHPSKSVMVINPPVKCKDFYVSKFLGDYYIVVSRFEPYKKVDLVIDAFNEMPDKKLLVVGKGSMKGHLQKIAKSNITFKEGLSSKELAKVFSECQALIFPQHEDYGITPLEANASGRPVIAYGVGGVLDTMIPHQDTESKATAIFFESQSVDSLVDAVIRFEKITFDPLFIRAHAEKFDEPVFVNKIQSFVKEKFEMNYE